MNQKVAIITGGSSGIGRATALAKDGVGRIDQWMTVIVVPRIKTAKPRIILGLIMSAAMATVLSFVLTISYVGLAPDFLSIWLHRLEISLLVGPPIALLLLPVVMKLVGKILKS